MSPWADAKELTFLILSSSLSICTPMPVQSTQGPFNKERDGERERGGGGWEALWYELRRNCVQHQASSRGRHRGGSTSYGRKTGKSKLKESRKCTEKRLQWGWRSSNTESKTHKEHAQQHACDTTSQLHLGRELQKGQSIKTWVRN